MGKFLFGICLFEQFSCFIEQNIFEQKSLGKFRLRNGRSKIFVFKSATFVFMLGNSLAKVQRAFERVFLDTHLINGMVLQKWKLELSTMYLTLCNKSRENSNIFLILQVTVRGRRCNHDNPPGTRQEGDRVKLTLPE